MISTGAGRRASSMPEEAPGDGGILSPRHRNNETSPTAELNLARIPSTVVSLPSNTQSSSSYKIVDLTSPSRPRKTHAIPVSNARVVRRKSQARDRAYAPDVEDAY
ncbi:unnamed protein product [Ixodes persulcatus]